MADDPNQDADENARNRAALAAYDRQRSMRDRHAAFVERLQGLNGNAEQAAPQGRGDGRRQPSETFGPPSPQPQLEAAAGDNGLAPPPPQFATDAAKGLVVFCIAY